jgi:N-acetylglucosaminyl-diphospho-decaprenol L-rhamnosyltransferase
VAADRPSLDVVIVSYRCEELLRDCLASLRDHAPAGSMRVHVVDNASGDGTAEMVRREFPEVALTVNEDNLGFSVANNVGIAAGSAPYVLVLNPDTRITPGALDALLAVIEERSEVGMVGPRLELDDGSFDHASRRSFPTPLGALGHFTGLGRGARSPAALAQYRAPAVQAGPVDAVNGAFMLIRRAALARVGGFDERYWMYMEDLDLCYRLAQAGWVTWYEPAVTVIHVKAGTSGQHRSLRLTYAFHYGMYRFYRDHYARDRNPLLNAAVYAGIAAKFAVAAVRSAVARGLGRLRRTGQ